MFSGKILLRQSVGRLSKRQSRLVALVMFAGIAACMQMLLRGMWDFVGSHPSDAGGPGGLFAPRSLVRAGHKQGDVQGREQDSQQATPEETPQSHQMVEHPTGFLTNAVALTQVKTKREGEVPPAPPAPKAPLSYRKKRQIQTFVHAKPLPKGSVEPEEKRQYFEWEGPEARIACWDIKPELLPEHVKRKKVCVDAAGMLVVALRASLGVTLFGLHQSHLC